MCMKLNGHIRNLFLAATLAIASAPIASAQKADKVKVDGKVSITRLFNDAIATARGSTVSLRYNSKSVMLGTVVSDKGHILTKGSELIFAMKKPADEDGLIVRLQDGTRHAATLIGYHEPTDIAMVKIEAKDLVPVNFVDSKLAEAGNMVAAPGMESEAVAAGIISAGVRKLYREEAIIDNGNKGYLGVNLAAGSEDKGVVIGAMEDNSPAKKAKLKVGDQIVSVEDRTIANFDDLKKVLSGYKPGDKVKVLVKRKADDSDDTEELSFEVKLGTKSSFDRSAFQNSMGSELSGRRTGFPMVITHDMVLEPKDCGGPLVDLEGRVLGINIARAGRVESWALPPEVVKPLIVELKAGKHPLKQ